MSRTIIILAVLAAIMGLVESSRDFDLKTRHLSDVAVPYFIPERDDMNAALDISPRGNPGDFTRNTGVSWIDILSTDIEAHSTAYESLRLGVFEDGDAHVGHTAGVDGQVRDLRLQINGGNVAIGPIDPTTPLDVHGDAIRIRQPKGPTDFCQQGTISWNTDFIYVCVAPDTWKRAALHAW